MSHKKLPTNQIPSYLEWCQTDFCSAVAALKSALPRVTLQDLGANQAFVRQWSTAKQPAEMSAFCWRIKNCRRILHRLHVDNSHVLRDNINLAHTEGASVVRSPRYAASVSQDGRLVKRFSAPVVRTPQLIAISMAVPAKQRQRQSS